jgi:hypothetical protein
MASTHLSLPIRLPFEERERHARLDTLTTRVANTLIENRGGYLRLQAQEEADNY